MIVRARGESEQVAAGAVSSISMRFLNSSSVPRKNVSVDFTFRKSSSKKRESVESRVHEGLKCNVLVNPHTVLRKPVEEKMFVWWSFFEETKV